MIVYKTYVRSLLRHSVQGWNPFLLKNLKLLEKVQWRATKLLGNISDLSYEDRLVAQKIFTCRVITDCNNLSQYKVAATLVSNFKKLLDGH